MCSITNISDWRKNKEDKENNKWEDTYQGYESLLAQKELKLNNTGSLSERDIDDILAAMAGLSGDEDTPYITLAEEMSEDEVRKNSRHGLHSL